MMQKSKQQQKYSAADSIQLIHISHCILDLNDFAVLASRTVNKRVNDDYARSENFKFSLLTLTVKEKIQTP